MNDSAPPAPESLRNFNRLKCLLREMFQLDRGDLDFGLYRIMNMKAGEIEAFLEEDLLPQVTAALEAISNDDRQRIDNELRDTIRRLEALQAPVEDNAKVKSLRAQLAHATADAEAEADVYGHLFNFFDRYYKEGDFMSLRRYSGGGESTYLIPYDGEEVKLHWANADQYYVKTTENYASYAFTAGEGDAAFRVRFEIAAADNEKDNIKEASGKQRRFVLAEDAVALDDGELVVRFEHRPLTEREKRDWPGSGARQQDRIDEDTAGHVLAEVERLDPARLLLALAAPAPTEADPDRTLLTKHVERYTAKNSFDYFIHKDLGGFLTRELDLYLKTDVLDLQDLALGDADRLRRALGRMKAVREIGGKLIAFLAQLENFQKRLWLKKKFVLETQWCVTLDRVPETFYPEIAANDAQRAEWADLFAIDEVADGEGDSFLKANPYLVLDTRHFDQGFKDRLLEALSEIEPLDEQTDGLLLRGENFQALNLLQARYAGLVQCIYIDPPYNTGNDGFLYRDSYRHSSWISMIQNRLELANNLLNNRGFIFGSIDENEMDNLQRVFDLLFPQRVNIVVILTNPKGRSQDKYLATSHDYLLSSAKSDDALLRGIEKSEDQLSEYSDGEDNDGPFRLLELRNTHRQFHRHNRPNLWYPVYVKRETGEVSLTFDENSVEVFPTWPDGFEGCWTWGKNKTETNTHLLAGRNVRGKWKVYRKDHAKKDGKLSTFVPKTIWNESDVRTDTGQKILDNLFKGERVMMSPKPPGLISKVVQISADNGDLILDYFSGSGTTGHAVINLNREDNGDRKYILVEMDDHFETVMLPRLKKAAYAPDWKDGEPVSRDEGVSQLIRYVRLESYEDTLDGLVVTPPEGDLLAENDPTLVEDYRLRYSLDAETAGSPCLLGRDFRDPFAYTLSVVRDGVRRETPVDLPETFNLLLGLRIETRRRLDGVLAIIGKDPQGQNCVILWRNLDDTDNEALNRWFIANRANIPEALELIYANGDHTLNAVRCESDTWKAEIIEPKFRQLMFETDER